MLGPSWKVKLYAIGILLVGFAGPVLNRYLHVETLNWATLCDGIAVILTGGALLVTKQADVHGGTVDTGTRPTSIDTYVAETAVAKKATRPPLP